MANSKFIAAYPGKTFIAVDEKKGFTKKVDAGIKLGERDEGFPIDGDPVQLLQASCLLAKKNGVGLNKWSFWIDGIEGDESGQLPLDAVLKLLPKIEKDELQIALLMTKNRGPKLRISADLNSNGRKSTADFMDLLKQVSK